MNYDDYIHHPLNTSITKNVCPFTKNKRFFPDLSPKSHDLTYEVKDVRSRRACSFGIGNKSSLFNKSTSPPPNNYTIKSSFDMNETQHKGFSFGAGRGQVRFGSLLKKNSNEVPGPGQYPIPSTMMNKSVYMGIRLNSDSEKYSRDVPGPGKYTLKQTEVGTTGRYVLSNYTQKCTEFSNPLSPTIRSKTIDLEGSGRRKKQAFNLGPGAYESLDCLNSTGKYSSAKYRSSFVRSFGRSARGSLGRNTGAPGPGTYHSFSEFGKVKDISKSILEVKLPK